MMTSKKPIKSEFKKPISIVPNGKEIEPRKPEFVKSESIIKPKPESIIKIKRPVGRPLKPEPTEEDKIKLELETKEIKLKSLKFLINGAFNLVSIKGGEHWKLNPEELTNLSQSTSDVLDLYHIDISKGSPILILVGSLLITVTPRIIKSKNMSKSSKNATSSPEQLIQKSPEIKPTIEVKSTVEIKSPTKILTNAERLAGKVW